MVDLGAPFSGASDINNRGQIVGHVVDQAVMWTDVGVWQELGILGQSPLGSMSSHASAINDRSWIVGYSTAPAGGAFLWTPQTGMRNLGFLDFGLDFHESFASDINKHGTVIGVSVGYYFFDGDYEMVRPRAFVWTPRTGMLALDDLVPAGWLVDNVIAINDHDEILASATHPDVGSHTVVLEPVNGRLK